MTRCSTRAAGSSEQHSVVTLRSALRDPSLEALHQYLDSWRGVGAIAPGMAHQDFDLQLTRYAERGWRANFYTSGIAHSVVSGTG